MKNDSRDFNVEKFNKNVGLLLNKQRMASGHSLESASILAGMTLNELERVEAGETSIACNKLFKLLESYPMDMDKFLFFCSHPSLHEKMFGPNYELLH